MGSALRRLLVSFTVLLLCAIVVVLVPGIDRAFYDVLASIPEQGTIDPPITLVTIDDTSFEILDRRWPWPRQWIADAVSELATMGASGIGIDIILSDRGFTEEEDRELADAISHAGNVVLVSKFVPADGTARLLEPRPEFLTNATSGYGNFVLDRDGVLRRYDYLESTRDELLFPSFAYALYESHIDREGSTHSEWVDDPFFDFVGDSAEFPATPGSLSTDAGQRLVNFSHTGRHGFQRYSFADILFGRIPADAVYGRIVMIGAAYPESRDYTPVPGGRDNPLYGVEIHAHALANLLLKDFHRELSLDTRLLVALLCVVVYAAVSILRFHLSLAASAALFVLSIVATAIAWRSYGVFVFPAVWLVCGAVSVPVITGAHALLESRERRRLRQFFGRYLPREVVEHVVAQPELPRLGGESRYVTVLFSDLVGFTTLSERTDPEVLVSMLNRYFDLMGAVIRNHGGMINKFIGDGIMALFGAPVSYPDPEDRAISAAIDMHLALNAHNADPTRGDEPALQMGIGIHAGDVILGNVGCMEQMDYTCIGDVVNVAARIETLTRSIGVGIIVSDTVRRKTSLSVAFGAAHHTTVKGRVEPVTVYAVDHFRTEVVS